MDSNYGKSGAITISGGNVFAYSATGSEEGIDCDNNSYIVVTDGIAVTAGGRMCSSGTSSIGSSTQKDIILALRLQAIITIKTGTDKPTACDVSVNDVFFINPTVTTTATAATVTVK